MLYEITKELATALAAKKFPYPVVYGPLPVRATGVSRMYVQVERDRGGNEPFAAPHSQHLNPPVFWKRTILGKVTIYAQSTLTGARSQDHERVADKIADMVASAIYVIGKKRKLLSVGITGRMVPAGDLENKELQQWPGAIYQMNVTLTRSVPYLTWLDEVLPTGTVEATETNSEITDWTPDTVEFPAENACSTHILPEGD